MVFYYITITDLELLTSSIVDSHYDAYFYHCRLKQAVTMLICIFILYMS